MAHEDEATCGSVLLDPAALAMAAAFMARLIFALGAIVHFSFHERVLAYRGFLSATAGSRETFIARSSRLSQSRHGVGGVGTGSCEVANEEPPDVRRRRGDRVGRDRERSGNYEQRLQGKSALMVLA
jgi:hypothetical protein